MVSLSSEGLCFLLKTKSEIRASLLSVGYELHAIVYAKQLANAWTWQEVLENPIKGESEEVGLV